MKCLLQPVWINSDVNIQILLTGLHAFLIVLVGRICLNINLWCSISLFSSPVCLAMYWYCNEKWHVDHYVLLQVISSTTSNKNCVSSIADSDILGFLFLTLHTLPSGEFLTLPTTVSLLRVNCFPSPSTPKGSDCAILFLSFIEDMSRYVSHFLWCASWMLFCNIVKNSTTWKHCSIAFIWMVTH